MTREERENALHCLKVMIDEEVCEECNLYGTTGTDHCEADCVRVAIKALEQQPCEDCISREAVMRHLENITMDTNPDHYECKDKWYQANGFNLCKVGIEIFIKNLPSVTPSIPDVENNYNIGYNCGYADAMIDIAEGE